MCSGQSRGISRCRESGINIDKCYTFSTVLDQLWNIYPVWWFSAYERMDGSWKFLIYRDNYSRRFDFRVFLTEV